MIDRLRIAIWVQCRLRRSKDSDAFWVPLVLEWKLEWVNRNVWPQVWDIINDGVASGIFK